MPGDTFLEAAVVNAPVDSFVDRLLINLFESGELDTFSGIGGKLEFCVFSELRINGL